MDNTEDNLCKYKPYYVYIIECANGSLYTGITTNIDRRFEEHKMSKKGAKYTRAFKPVKLRALWKTKTNLNAKSLAGKLESRIKMLNRKNKIQLIEDKNNFNVTFITFDDFCEFNEFLRIF